MYLDLGPDNGGFPINISEDGIAFQGVQPLAKDEEIRISLRLDGSDEMVVSRAKVIWLTKSKKAGGLQFIDLPDYSRRLIRDWISSQKLNDPDYQSTRLKTPHVKSDALPGRSPAPPQVERAKPSQAAENVPTVASSAAIPLDNSEPAIVLNDAAESKSDGAKSSSAQVTQQPARIPRNPGMQPRLAKSKAKSWRSGKRFGLAAAIVISILCGVTVWVFRGDLLRRLDGTGPVRGIDSVAAPVALAAEQLPVTGNSVATSIDETSTLNSGESEPIDLPLPALPTARRPALRNLLPNPPAAPIDHRAAATLPAPSSISVLPDKPAIGSTKSPTSVDVSSAPNPGAANEAGATAAKMTALVPTPPANSMIPTESVEIISDPYPSIHMPAQARPSQQGTSLRIGRAVSTVDPQYPPEALRRHIAGTVSLHLVIGKNGTVETTDVVDGPAVLADAAVRAVQQWHYEPTMLGTSAIEVEEDVRLVFRLSSSSAAAN
jgi:TonB family protein